MNESREADDFVADEFFKGCAPDSYMSVSEWADKFRVLSSKSASEPERWQAKVPSLILENWKDEPN